MPNGIYGTQIPDAMVGLIATAVSAPFTVRVIGCGRWLTNILWKDSGNARRTRRRAAFTFHGEFLSREVQGSLDHDPRCEGHR